ncbi:MAG TPA: bacteriohemerythrin [Desulfobulbaceae bacterium]|nr:bacteriohemerythrin [Desulfobulbaceae bacterium]
MPLIKWRDSYSVGIEKFDKEHRHLVELINRMFVIVRDKDNITAVSDAVARLIDYTEFHFSSEEAAMKEAGFPNLAAHQQLHARLTQEISAFQQKIVAEESDVGPKFYRFLRDWLLGHILEEDKQYTQYMIATANR